MWSYCRARRLFSQTQRWCWRFCEATANNPEPLSWMLASMLLLTAIKPTVKISAPLLIEGNSSGYALLSRTQLYMAQLPIIKYLGCCHKHGWTFFWGLLKKYPWWSHLKMLKHSSILSSRFSLTNAKIWTQTFGFVACNSTIFAATSHWEVK